MPKTAIYKSLPLMLGATIILSSGSAALAHDPAGTANNISALEQQERVSKENARNLVKSLLKRDYSGSGYKARVARKTDGKWIVRIKHRTQTVATALVDAQTGNIHVK